MEEFVWSASIQCIDVELTLLDVGSYVNVAFYHHIKI